MKKAFRKSISLLLCAVLLATSFTVPGLISYASENIAQYSVFVYEMDTEGVYCEAEITTYEAEIDCTVVANPEDFLKEGFSVDEERSKLSGVVAADGTTVLEVYLMRNFYTLTLNYNGGYCGEEYEATLECIYGSVIEIQETPVKEGCTFVGWSTDGIEPAQYPFVMPAENVTLYAAWEFIPYELTFNANSGYFENEYNNEIIRYTCYYGEQIPYAESPVKDGYTFVGWSMSQNAYEPDFYLETMPFQDLTLFAVWHANDGTEYKVEYYYMNTDGTYDDYPTETIMCEGRTDDVATQANFECPVGFTLDESLGCVEDVIRGDGSTL
ncbi:MAG: InlB B-repeat-containing protein, partial [Clostridia bacterium]|nr:InlB B-repeat-containing protein [Clostridia bacterium]